MDRLIVVLIELERNNFVMFLILPLRNYKIDRFFVPGTPVVSDSHIPLTCPSFQALE